MPLSVLVFNVEYGGTPATDAAIRDVHADVVGVLESYNRLPEIAAAAGYPYYDLGLQILSKYPILEPSAAHGLYAYIEVRPGEAVAMIDTHLDYVQDGPNRLNRGVPVAAVLRTERQDRLSTIRTLLPSAKGLLADGWPPLLDRRPQRALAPGLDGADRRPAPWHRAGRLAGERGADVGRARGLLPGGAPGPGHRSRHTWGGSRAATARRDGSTTRTSGAR